MGGGFSFPFFPSPTPSPTQAPTPAPVPQPTPFPSLSPTLRPTSSPSLRPSGAPTSGPTLLPTVRPTAGPSKSPSGAPSGAPTRVPTDAPSTSLTTLAPTNSPTFPPSATPTAGPTSTSPVSDSPTRTPTQSPTGSPSLVPTSSPTEPAPTNLPTGNPTEPAPTNFPTPSPTGTPTAGPSLVPTSSPTEPAPTNSPTGSPTTSPTTTPTAGPSIVPTSSPTGPAPTNSPTGSPTTSPTDPLTIQDVCPLDRVYPPIKYEIEAFTASTTSGVEDDLSEISSLAFSDQTDAEGNLYAYVASDKNQFSLKVVKFPRPAEPNLNVLAGKGVTVATYSLNVNFDNSDWEDIAIGPCGEDDPNATLFAQEFLQDRNCIYVGNFGNNNRGSGYEQRSVLKIFKFVEPLFGALSPPLDLVDVPVTTILYNYAPPFAQGVFLDAEGLFVDWTGGVNGEGKGDIYVVTKGKCGKGIGQIPASHHQTLSVGNISPDVDVPEGANVYPMVRVLEDPPKQGFDQENNVVVDCSEGPFRIWQGADMKRDGSLIALITGISPPRVHFYPRLPGQTVVQALEGPGSSINNGVSNCDYVASTSYGLTKNERKHEAVAFTPDGKSFADTSECRGGSACEVPIYFWDLIFADDTTTNGQILVPAHDDGLWETITFDDFETGDHLGSYVNGTRSFPSQANPCPLNDPSSNWSVEIFLHDGEESAIVHATSYDASTYSWLKVQFDFLMDGFDYLDTLFLELSLNGGEDFYFVADWAKDVQGIVESEICYDSSVTTVILQASDFGASRVTFGSEVKLRFRTSANAKNDKIYLDNIGFEGHI